MKKGSNAEYIFKNLDREVNIVDWIYSINNFFGEEKAEQFYKSYIDSHHILQLNDIRRLIITDSLSVYAQSKNEQIAFITAYNLIDTEKELVKKLGVEKAQKHYREKSIKLSKMLKSMGFSYITIWCNWKDKKQKDTYQRDLVFVVFGENKTQVFFKTCMLSLAKDNNIKAILITDALESDAARIQLKSRVYDTEGNLIKKYSNTIIESLEEYLGKISDTKVKFKLEYENNKTVICADNKRIADYYSKKKQEKLKHTLVTSCNMGMHKQSLLQAFDRADYNN